jgi:hypothetical protein
VFDNTVDTDVRVGQLPGRGLAQYWHSVPLLIGRLELNKKSEMKINILRRGSPSTSWKSSRLFGPSSGGTDSNDNAGPTSGTTPKTGYNFDPMASAPKRPRGRNTIIPRRFNDRARAPTLHITAATADRSDDRKDARWHLAMAATFEPRSRRAPFPTSSHGRQGHAHASRVCCARRATNKNLIHGGGGGGGGGRVSAPPRLVMTILDFNQH